MRRRHREKNPKVTMHDIELVGRIGAHNFIQQTHRFSPQELQVMEEKYKSMQVIKAMKKKMDWYEAGSTRIAPLLALVGTVVFFLGFRHGTEKIAL